MISRKKYGDMRPYERYGNMAPTLYRLAKKIGECMCKQNVSLKDVFTAINTAGLYAEAYLNKCTYL